jgi:hypothetical protein
MRIRSIHLVLTVAAVWLFAQPAAAQNLGVRAGASANPDQFYFGVHGDTGAIVEELHFRPNLEVGVGDDVTLVGVNFEFVYPFPIEDTDWNIYPGIGPALNIVNFNDNTESFGGINIVLGVEHRDGFFAEIKVGAIDSPDFKFGVGYSFSR